VAYRPGLNTIVAVLEDMLTKGEHQLSGTAAETLQSGPGSHPDSAQANGDPATVRFSTAPNLSTIVDDNDYGRTSIQYDS
jgi:hypothetical protein